MRTCAEQGLVCKRGARILLASKKFQSVTWISHGTNELAPHFLMCKLEDEK